jgi:hypothetical protein
VSTYRAFRIYAQESNLMSKRAEIDSSELIQYFLIIPLEFVEQSYNMFDGSVRTCAVSMQQVLTTPSWVPFT